VVREIPTCAASSSSNDAALWYSRDGGASWNRSRAEFPTVPVYDMQFIKRSHDLVIARTAAACSSWTHITAVEELTPDVIASDFHVFSTLQPRFACARGARASPRRASPRERAGRRGDRLLPQGRLDTAGPVRKGRRAGRARRGA